MICVRVNGHLGWINEHDDVMHSLALLCYCHSVKTEEPKSAFTATGTKLCRGSLGSAATACRCMDTVGFCNRLEAGSSGRPTAKHRVTRDANKVLSKGLLGYVAGPSLDQTHIPLLPRPMEERMARVGKQTLLLSF